MSDNSDFEDGEFQEDFVLPPVESVQPQDLLGQDLKFLGYIMSSSGDLCIVETSSTTTFGPGSLVVSDDYSPFGHVVDIFGPVLRPLYIVKPTNESMAVKSGIPLYICEKLCKREDPDQSEVSEEGEIESEKSSDASEDDYSDEFSKE